MFSASMEPSSTSCIFLGELGCDHVRLSVLIMVEIANQDAKSVLAVCCTSFEDLSPIRLEAVFGSIRYSGEVGHHT